MTNLVHGTHVDDAVPLWRRSQDLIQNLLHVQLLTLGVVKAVHDGGPFNAQLLQDATPGGCRGEQQVKTFLQFLIHLWSSGRADKDGYHG